MIDGTKPLIREIGAYFHKEDAAEKLCGKLDSQMAEAIERLSNTAIIRVSLLSILDVHLTSIWSLAKRGEGDAAGAGQMVEWAGGEMAVNTDGMQRMALPEVIAQANPDVILVTDFGFDRIGGSLDRIKALAWRRYIERRKK